jgi:hypothetical protein
MDEYVAFELKHAPSLEHASLCGAVGMIFLRQGIATRTSASGALAGGGAVELLGEEFSIVHKVLGDRHPTTARAYLRLADAYVHSDRPSRSIIPVRPYVGLVNQTVRVFE